MKYFKTNAIRDLFMCVYIESLPFLFDFNTPDLSSFICFHKIPNSWSKDIKISRAINTQKASYPSESDFDLLFVSRKSTYLRLPAASLEEAFRRAAEFAINIHSGEMRFTSLSCEHDPV